MLGQALRFALTGGAATAMHLAVAMLLISLGWPPLSGNAVAFLVAFTISFWGHHLFTFAGHGAAATEVFRRFVIVALAGFVWNEAMLWLLLAWGLFGAEIAVLLSTASAAAGTYVLSRLWVFAGSRPSLQPSAGAR